MCFLIPFLQTYARFTGAPLKVHKIANPWRSPSGIQSLGDKEGSVQGEEQETGSNVVQICMNKQLRIWWAYFFLNVRNSACPSNQSWRSHLGTTQDHHPPSKRGKWLEWGASSGRSSVSSVQYSFIKHQTYANLNTGDPEHQGAHILMRKTYMLSL